MRKINQVDKDELRDEYRRSDFPDGFVRWKYAGRIRDTIIDPTDESGHLYGAIIASLRDCRSFKAQGKYAEYHMAYCAHYVGDLSMPLHNTVYDDFNRQHHSATDGIVEDEVLNHLGRIKIYPIVIKSEDDLVRETVRIANLSMKLGYRLEAEGRMLSKDEAYEQLGRSASLLKAILEWVR